MNESSNNSFLWGGQIVLKKQKMEKLKGCINCNNRVKNNSYPHDYGICKLTKQTIHRMKKVCNEFTIKQQGLFINKKGEFML